jgi:hypothetical protein
MITVFVGYDTKETIAYHVCCNSIICKAVILSIIGKSYSFPSLTVKHKLSFSTPS